MSEAELARYEQLAYSLGSSTPGPKKDVAIRMLVAEVRRLQARALVESAGAEREEGGG